MMIYAFLIIAFLSSFVLLHYSTHAIIPTDRLMRFFFLSVVASFVVVIASAPSLWMALANGYPNDSFFDLSFFGRLGVLSIGLVLIVSFLGLIIWKTNKLLRLVSKTAFYNKSRTARCLVLLFDNALGILMFGCLHALSPQAYYQFYHLIYPDLPQQIVIKTLFDYDGIAKFALLAADGNLSQHLSGLVLLSIVPMTGISHIWYHRKSTDDVSGKFLFINLTIFSLLSVNIFRHFT